MPLENTYDASFRSGLRETSMDETPHEADFQLASLEEELLTTWLKSIESNVARSLIDISLPPITFYSQQTRLGYAGASQRVLD